MTKSLSVFASEPQASGGRDVLDLLDVDLVEELGFEVYSEAERQPLLLQAREVVDKRLQRRLFSLLSPDDRCKFDRLLEQLEHERVFPFLESRIPSLRLVTAEVIAEFRRDLETWKAWVAKSRAWDELESSDR